MSNPIGRRSGGFSQSRIRRRRSHFSRRIIAVVALGLGAAAAVSLWDLPDSKPATSEPDRKATPVIIAAANAYEPLLDSGYSLGHAPQGFGRSTPLGAEFLPSTPAEIAAPHPPVRAVEPKPAPMPPDASQLVQNAPLPMPRPPGLRSPTAPERPAIASPQPSQRRVKTVAVPATPADNRSFFEKLFGVRRSPGEALAYAAPQDDVVDAGRGRRLSPLPSTPLASAARTAVYDISARVVHMPNGDKLEAHSGLGDKLDDPRFAHVRMQGVTPPHVYDLTEREALFHGVRALRLNPVGGSGAIHGRAGLLAHTYLLGPNGDSNGCVSFRDYDKFLQAFLRGEVRRLVVVAKMG